MRNEKYLIILVSIFAGSIAIASVLANKIINIFGLFVPAGILAYSATFIATDVISEIWGKEKANVTVLGGFLALVFVFLLVRISLLLPEAPFWHQEEAFQTIMGSTSRIIVASLIAYLVSQFHDVWAFHFWKKITKDRHLWLRNNLSTAVSQFVDSFLFVTIAFYNVLPVWPLILGQWIVKLTIALSDTPIIYFLVWLIRRKTGIIMEKNKNITSN
ncbi:queuosine precursor transporter [Desulfonema magnum]|uniref:Probable queuosine precursor transporter n=1 Tax=Desulfonema magnum TaxID=45655 RepID=A0A975BTB5_9BACT|nr:queuosine precursor transporter [Desulfonema magnum]QTA91384.1 Putative queosine precursor transporter [Desulfonema magnum]